MAQIDRLFQYLVESGGSDLHLSEGQPPKVRVHGGVSAIPNEAVLDGTNLHSMLQEICDPKAFEGYMETGDLDFAYEMDVQSRFRCNYLKQKNGLAAVFRLIPTEIASLEDLNVPQVIKEFGHMRSGLVLITAALVNQQLSRPYSTTLTPTTIVTSSPLKSRSNLFTKTKSRFSHNAKCQSKHHPSLMVFVPASVKMPTSYLLGKCET